MSKEMQLASNFQRQCNSNGVYGLPTFAKIQNNALYLRGYPLNSGNISALSQFVKNQSIQWLEQRKAIMKEQQ